MQTYPIYAFTQQCGTLTRQEAGLYEKLEAVAPDDGTIIRFYLVGTDQTLLLGTALPEDGKLVCRKTVSRRQLPEHPLAAMIYSARQEHWQQEGELLWRMTPQWVEIAQPYMEGESVVQVEHYPQLQPQQIEGKDYLVRHLSLAEFLQEQLEQ